MNDLQIFNNEEFGEVRTAVINDEPMFCLADICKALELTQPSKVKERLNEKEYSRLYNEQMKNAKERYDYYKSLSEH